MLFENPKTFKEQILNFVARISTEMRVLLNTVKTPFKGATAAENGAMGVVPAPVAGEQTKVLHGDGTWKPVNTAAHADSVDVSGVVNLNVGAKNFTGSSSGLTVNASRDTYGRLTGVSLSGLNTNFCSHCAYCTHCDCFSSYCYNPNCTSYCDCGDDQS